MRIKPKEIVKCDICGQEKNCINVNYPVLFSVDDTEGKACDTYIENKQLDICRECSSKLLKVIGVGDPRYNKYQVVE